MMLLMEQDSERAELARIMHSREFITPETHVTVPRNPQVALQAMGGAEAVTYLLETEYLTQTQTQYELDRMTGVDTSGVRQRWGEEEGWHGKVYQSILQQCGVDVELPRPRPMKKGIERLGALAARHSWFKEALNLTIPVTGHIHERENQYVQHVIIARLVAAGERSLARTIGAMRAQETTHDRYYLADIAEKKSVLMAQEKGWVITLSHLITTVGFSPVGANNDELRKRMGKVMQTFMESKDQIEKFEAAIEELVADVLHSQGRFASAVTRWQVKRIVTTFENCLQMLKTTQ